MKKKRCKYTKIFACMFLCFVVHFHLPAQEQKNDSEYITVTGIVRDQKTKKGLSSVNIYLSGSSIGTVTNVDGRFSLKIKNIRAGDRLEITHLGYESQSRIIPHSISDEITIFLKPSALILDEVVVISGEAEEIVKKAIDRVETNYSTQNKRMIGFYRETVQKRKRYINIAEAVIDIYKTPYTKGVNADRLQIHKGRKLLSQRAKDTLAVKLQGGPNIATICDFVKNPNMLFDPEIFTLYSFRFDKTTLINDRAHYTILFKPRFLMETAMYHGKLYIDKDTYTFTRAEFYLDMSNRDKATQVILRKKPRGLRFKPKELSIVMSYKRHEGVSSLNYIRNKIHFNCDWKRRIFTTNYTVTSEAVITDIQDSNVEKISYKDTFKKRHSLSDKVHNFYDENFWEDYNIIEPSESLETAVDRLKKRNKR